MNERIKELLLKAGFTNAYSDPKEGFELMFVDEEHTTESVAKFAELIVRECARVYWNIDNGETHTEYVEALKQHFGVEE